MRTVPGVGPITALTWALEIGDFTRFRSIKEAISYCGLCGDENSSADKVMRMPLSKQRNKHIQRVLVEAAKLAPRECHELAVVRQRELERGNPNRATLAVARKMVCYLLAVERSKQDFVPAEQVTTTAAAWKPFLRREKHRDSPCAGCQVPHVGDSAKEITLPRLSSNRFRTGREHKFNLR